MLPFFKKNKIQPKSEKELIDLAKNDHRFFAPIYEKYYEQIFRFVYKRMSGLDESNDVTSQIFLKALTHLKSYKHTGVPFSAWLYRIALNEINQYYRSTKKKRTVNLHDSDLKSMADDLEAAYNFDLQDKMIEVLNKFDEAKILLIEMRYFEKRSFKEIASILNITESNAKIRVYRLLDEFKKKLIK